MYIFKIGDSYGFTDFPVEGAVPISNENYNRFFEFQSQGKQFKLKDINSIVFEEIFEEYIPEPVEPISQEPSANDKLQARIEAIESVLIELI